MFWKDFYLSAEQFFLPNQEKKYFVFTDAEEIYAEENPNVVKIYQGFLGWPYDTLMRFDIFSKVQAHLEKCEYLFFINANMRFLDIVGNEVLPGDENDGLMAVLHPYFWNARAVDFTYDRNIRSLAYIEPGAGNHYFMGGFNGGKSASYLKLINTLRDNIEADLNNGVIALWHDESHLNKYLLDKHPLVLSPEYGFPEGLNIPFKTRVIILDKNKLGGHSFLRSR